MTLCEVMTRYKYVVKSLAVPIQLATWLGSLFLSLFTWFLILQLKSCATIVRVTIACQLEDISTNNCVGVVRQ